MQLSTDDATDRTQWLNHLRYTTMENAKSGKDWYFWFDNYYTTRYSLALLITRLSPRLLFPDGVLVGQGVNFSCQLGRKGLCAQRFMAPVENVQDKVVDFDIGLNHSLALTIKGEVRQSIYGQWKGNFWTYVLMLNWTVVFSFHKINYIC